MLGPAWPLAHSPQARVHGNVSASSSSLQDDQQSQGSHKAKRGPLNSLTLDSLVEREIRNQSALQRVMVGHYHRYW